VTDLLAQVADDSGLEAAELDALIAPLDSAGWALPTPAEGFTIRHTVAHLHAADRAGLAAVSGGDVSTFIEDVFYGRSDLENVALLEAWRRDREQLRVAVAGYPPGSRIPWFGPAMSPVAFLTARLMEAWAHGQDVADALGVERIPTDRLRHVAELGVRTRGWSYTVRGLAPPETPVYVELTAPSGDTWTWGSPDAPDAVRGPALDFCLLVVQRRHRDDLALVATGADADQWLSIAQAFAGPPTDGRHPR